MNKTNEYGDSPIVIVSTDKEIRRTFAKEFAKRVIRQSGNASTETKLRSDNHPDIYEMVPEGKSDLYLIDTVKEFIHEIAMPPFEAKQKVYIIHDADKMLPIHANALLKTLEEKPSHSVVCLTTENRKRLLPTILSRCQVMTVPSGKEEVGKPTESICNGFFAAAAGNLLELSTHIDAIAAEIEEGKGITLTDLLTIFLNLIRDLEVIRLKIAIPLHYESETIRYKTLPECEEITFEWGCRIVDCATDGIARSMRPKQIIGYVLHSLVGSRQLSYSIR